MSKGIFNKNILPLADRMFRYAISMLHSSSTAEDVVQDSLLKIWDRRKTLHTIKNPEAWAMRVVRNGCLDNIRASRFTTFDQSHENKLFVNNEDIMGIGESVVKVNLHRARTKVRETMKKVEAYGVNRNIAG